MNFKQLCTDLSKEMDPAIGAEMSKLFNGKFVFKGLDQRARTKIMNNQFESKNDDDSEIDWEFVETCWDQNIREFQYFAISYLIHMRDHLEKSDLSKIKRLIEEKPEWDTNNQLHKLVNLLTALYPELNSQVVAWSREDNAWTKRTALLYQLGRGPYLNEDYLAEILDHAIHDDREIIQKAIVHSLSDAYHDHKDFVEQYIHDHKETLDPAITAEFLQA